MLNRIIVTCSSSDDSLNFNERQMPASALDDIWSRAEVSDWAEIQLCREGNDFPAIMILLTNFRAVMQLMISDDKMLLLVGDGTVPDGDSQEFMGGGDEVVFDGLYISTLSRTRLVTKNILEGEERDRLGSWDAL